MLAEWIVRYAVTATAPTAIAATCEMIDRRKADDTTTSRVVVRNRLTGQRVMLPEADVGSTFAVRGKCDADNMRGAASTIAVADVVVSPEGTI